MLYYNHGKGRSPNRKARPRQTKGASPTRRQGKTGNGYERGARAAEVSNATPRRAPTKKGE